MSGRDGWVFGKVLGKVLGGVLGASDGLYVDNVRSRELTPLSRKPPFRHARRNQQDVGMRPASFGSLPYQEVFEFRLREPSLPSFEQKGHSCISTSKSLFWSFRGEL